MKLTTIVLSFLIVFCVAHAQVPHIYLQTVRNVPDTTGYMWYTWDLYNMGSPNDYLDKNSLGSGCVLTGDSIIWFTDAGNFLEHIWANGDTVITFGSWDEAYASNPGTYGDNPDHTGYYWLFSDTLNATMHPQPWVPADTMWVMPAPIAGQTSESDSVRIRIPNPMETRRGDQTEYDVAGYWLIADTTGFGTPNSYDIELGFVPVQGGIGDTTEYVYYPMDVIGVDTWMHFHAYYIVARPETTMTPGVVPGFSTLYSSRNSNYLPSFTHTLQQTVEQWPAVLDETGVQWVVYDLYHAKTHVLAESSPGCSTVYVPNEVTWYAAIENFPSWQDGDTVIAFGSWDSAYAFDPGSYGSNVNHTGFYWLFSDTLDASQTNQTWLPNDRLRPMPKPIVYKTGIGAGANDTIWVKIPNPEQTMGLGTYDVLGYWIWADTTNSGTPNAFGGPLAQELGFAPVQGGFGDTTTFYLLESMAINISKARRTWIAYKLVIRPDTSSVVTMGHASYYFSQNPDSSMRLFWSDTTAPVIESTTVWTDTSYAGPFRISTRVTDAPAGVDDVYLEYKIGADTIWHVRQMQYTGTGGIYLDSIPAITEPDQLVRYYVRGVDYYTNASTDPAGAPTVSYAFIANILVDTIGPIIDSTTQYPDTMQFAGPYEIKTKVRDYSGVRSVRLLHRIGSASSWTQTFMTDIGAKWWVDSIPAVGPDDSVRYYVEAYDSLNNMARDPSEAPDTFYAFIGNWQGVEEYGQNSVGVMFMPQNNPSHGDVHFLMRLPEDAEVTLRIYDCTGRFVTAPIDTRMRAGSYDIHVKQPLSTGIYFYSLELPNENKVGKFIVVR